MGNKNRNYGFTLILITIYVAFTNLFLSITFLFQYYKLKPLSDMAREMGVEITQEEVELFSLLINGGTQGLIVFLISSILLFGFFKKKKWDYYH